MTAAEFAAYVGAAAWLPQIGSWIYRRFVKPVITVVPDRYAEVGFTIFGPIFNVRMAFAADAKDALIDGVEFVLTHHDGDAHKLHWAGLNEMFSEIRDETTGNRSVISRDQTPIAIRVGVESLVEKFVRFQEAKFIEAVRPHFTNLVAHFNFVRQSGDPEYVEKILASKELYELTDTRKKAFWWKPGKYTLTLNLSSPRKFKLTRSTWSFELTAADVDALKQNLAAIDMETINIVRSNSPDFQAQPVNWNWANVNVAPA